jgi:hypothetical protein
MMMVHVVYGRTEVEILGCIDMIRVTVGRDSGDGGFNEYIARAYLMWETDLKGPDTEYTFEDWKPLIKSLMEPAWLRVVRTEAEAIGATLNPTCVAALLLGKLLATWTPDISVLLPIWRDLQIMATALGETGRSCIL